METSINTSKRKFQSLLDNISNTAKSDSASKHGKNEHSTRDRPLKRLRLGQSQLQRHSRTNKVAEVKNKPVADRTSRRSQYNHSRDEKLNTSADGRDNSLAGAYAPWSREAFLKRLYTFADPKVWSLKPEAINELQWAKRGWICEDKETVACKGLCEQRLAIDLSPSQRGDGLSQDSNESEEAHDIHQLEETLAQKYRELIMKAHSDHCLWRKSGCKEDIYRLPLLRSTYWKSSFISRYESLVQITEQLPRELDVPEMDDVERAAANILSNCTPQNGLNGHISPIATKLALFGWEGDLIGELAISRCASCFQRIGLWLYNTADEEDNDNRGGLHSEHKELLDPFNSHKYYCPWINANMQYASGKYSGKAGWEILQDMISQNYAESDLSSEVNDGVEEQQHNAVSAEIKDDARLSKLQQLKKIFNFKKRT